MSRSQVLPLSRGPRRRAILVAAVLAGLGSSPPRPAHAALPDDRPAIAIGLSTGYGVPFGSLAGSGSSATSTSTTTFRGSSESDTISGQVPVAIDAGVRIDAHFYVGGFFSYGFGLVPTNVCQGFSCSIDEIRFGLEGRYHFATSRLIDPFVGLGAGYEILNASASETVAGSSVSSNLTFSGLEYANLQIGADSWVSSQASVGVYATFSAGQYSSASANGTSIDSFPTALHEWLMLGIRGEFDIPIGQGKSDHPATTETGSQGPASGGPAASASADASSSSTTTPATPIAPSPPAAAAPPTPTPPAPPPPAAAPAPPPARPGGWPATVRVASRGACSLVCVDLATGGTIAASRVEGPLSRQLGAFRACALGAGGGGGEAPRPVVVRFDASGAGAVQYDTGGGASLVQCTSNIPPPAISGPPGASWRCTDYCQ